MYRPDPQLPVTAVQTYAIHAPRSTHFVDATCVQVECADWQNGWRSRIDERTELGMGQAYYIRKESGRSFREEKDEQGLTVFTFAPGQRCFRGPHRRRLDRPEIYVVRNGDWRANLGLKRQHVRAADWVEDFALHQQAVANRQQRG